MANDNQQAFGWFLAGLGIGALVGILYAPKSGRETREDIANTAKDGAEYVRVRGREYADQAGQFVDRTKEQAGEYAHRTKDQATEYVQRGKEIVDRGRAQWEDFVERGKGFVNDQSAKVSAAVDAGKHAYAETTAAPGEGPLS